MQTWIITCYSSTTEQPNKVKEVDCMAIATLPVDQRVIDIDSRRFASVEKALVELITNSDDSYVRLEKTGAQVTGHIRVKYERHQNGAVLVVTDQAEGMSFERVCSILAYGGAHSPLARGEGGGRGYFGRGLKQAIYGLGYGWIETIHAGRFSRIELFRNENGGYLYDDWGGDRPAAVKDYSRLGIAGSGTQVTIVIENAHFTSAAGPGSGWKFCLSAGGISFYPDAKVRPGGGVNPKGRRTNEWFGRLVRHGGAGLSVF